jgi:hypothetical protein
MEQWNARIVFWNYFMSRNYTFEWTSLLILFLVLGWWYFVQIRFVLRRHRSKRWPTVDATLQKGAVGRISFGKGASAPATFVGYAYIVQGVRYAGFFALYGDGSQVHKLQESLTGALVQIRYDPSDPNVSYLADHKDSRFDGLAVTQNPEWLDQSPAFDLQDAVR